MDSSIATAIQRSGDIMNYCLFEHPVIVFFLHRIDVIVSEKTIWALRPHRNESGRIYFLKNWTDLDISWHRDREFERSDPAKFLVRSLKGPQRKCLKTTLFGN